MTQKELIDKGIQENLIKFDDNFIIYLHQNKRRNYNNPEEKVQAITFLKLILEYNYPVTHIKQFEPIKMGVSSKEADIVVFSDETLIQIIYQNLQTHHLRGMK